MIKIIFVLFLLFSNFVHSVTQTNVDVTVNPIGIFDYSNFNAPKLSFSTSSETSTKKLIDTPSTLEISISTTDGATFADISSSMNCATGDINLSASIPDVKNFKDALKIFAPFAVDDTTGDVDFGNFLSELISEQVFQESTEALLDFLAFIHYQVSTSLADPSDPTGSLVSNFELFKTEVFKSCLADKIASGFEDVTKLGFGFMSQDVTSFTAGIDITSLLGMFSCVEDQKNSGKSHQDFLKGFEKSKKIVRAIFNQILNGSLNFTQSMSEECSAYFTEISKDSTKLTKSGKESNDSFKSATQTYIDTSGNKSISSLVSDKITVVLPTTSTEVKTGNVSQTQSTIESSDGTGTVTAGKITTKTEFDFTARTELVKYDGDIDLLELSPLSRAAFYNKTYDDFFKSITESPKFQSMSSLSRAVSAKFIKKIITMQQFNKNTWTDLSCILDIDLCQKSITNFEYDLLVNADGYPYECDESSLVIYPGTPAIARCTKQKLKAYTGSLTKTSFLPTLKEDHDPVGGGDADLAKVLIQKYTHKKLWLKVEDLVHDYFIALGGFVFPEDYSQLDSTGAVSGDDYLKKRISLLSFGKLINDYWSSPIKNISQSTLDKLTSSLDSSDSHTSPAKDDILTAIDEISNNANDNLVSFTPLIYEPLRELQLAKVLFQVATPTHIIKILHDKQTTLPHTQIKRVNTYKAATPIEPYDSVNFPAEDGLGNLIASVPFQSPFGHQIINQAGVSYESYTFVYNNSENSAYNLSIEELDNIAIITDKFKDFFIKRLLVNLTNDANVLLRGTIFNNKGIGNPNGEETVKYDLKIFEYKQKQRREMLKLLLY